jgi:hypothetical protein
VVGGLDFDFAAEQIEHEGDALLDVRYVDLEKIPEIEIQEHGGDADEESAGCGDHGLADSACEVGGF